MPAAAVITETLIRENINRAVSDVFKTMLGRIPTFVSVTEMSRRDDMAPPPPGPASGMTTFVVGTVGFLGDINGLIYLCLDEPFARLTTCHLLGLSEAEAMEAGDEAVNDAIGEITNMTVGSFKNGLCDAGYPCMLTIPSILRGSNFSIEPISSTTRYVYNFESTGHKVAVDILLKGND
ncbi:MAG: chemotaxis protein CheX [Opitutae bacterium]|nr:chemotaxis protein CheX [Opitutae bacterium]